MTKKEKIRETVFYVLEWLCFAYMGIVMMVANSEDGTKPLTHTEHICYLVVGIAMTAFMTWFIGRNLYRLWTNRSILTGEPIDDEFNTK